MRTTWTIWKEDVKAAAALLFLLAVCVVGYGVLA